MTAPLRSADPAADLVVDPDLELMRTIMAAPHSSVRRRSLRRIAVGGLAVAAAAVAALVLPTWSHDGAPSLGAKAYAVTRNGDGSVSVVLHWSELDDPNGLQAALDKAGAHTLVLFGVETAGPSPTPAPQPPACAVPYYGRSYSSRAVQWDFPNAATEVNGVVIRPRYFPKNGTFVIEAYRQPGSSTYAPVLSFMARGAVPSCVYPQYTG